MSTSNDEARAMAEQRRERAIEEWLYDQLYDERSRWVDTSSEEARYPKLSELAINGARELRALLSSPEAGAEERLSVPELEDCALACETFGTTAGVKAGAVWQRLANRCSRLARLRATDEGGGS